VTTEVTGALGIGFACAAGQGCQLVTELEGSVTKAPEWTVKLLPTAGDLRFKPSLEAFGFVEGAVGSPVFKSLRLTAAEAKVGPKVELDWAPHAIQIADTKYASEFKAELELAVSAGADLEGIADRLGLGDILKVELKKSFDLEGSPKGTLDLSKTTLGVGQPTTATVNLTENVSMLAIYNIAKVVLVGSSGGVETELATVTATAGQVAFDLPFTPTQAYKPSELHAFVVAKFPPGDIIDFEVAAGGGGGIVFWRNGKGVWSIKDDGTGLGQITSGGWDSRPSWSPDRSKIVFDHKSLVQLPSGLSVANADGSNQHVLLAAPPGVSDTSIVEYLYPTFSPDGTRIAFVEWRVTDGAIDTGISVVNADGSGLRRLTHNLGGLLGRPQPGELAPSWSPDGQRIVFLRRKQNEASAHIFVVNADGSGIKQLTNGVVIDAAPDWSPDGTEIVFVRVETGTTHRGIWIMAPDGSGPRAILSDLQSNASPSWSPDGTRIAYCRGVAAPGEIVVMNADGSNLTVFAAGAGCLSLDWGYPGG
jgi:Periplasmic component of the Tol biopolymer transport system